jgi:hypothetical protein
MTSDIIKRLEAARAGSKPSRIKVQVFILGHDPKRWPAAARSAYWDTVKALNAWNRDHEVPFGRFDNLAVANRAIREAWGYRNG